jgi:hypothetical protein
VPCGAWRFMSGAQSRTWTRGRASCPPAPTPRYHLRHPPRRPAARAAAASPCADGGNRARRRLAILQTARSICEQRTKADGERAGGAPRAGAAAARAGAVRGRGLVGACRARRGARGAGVLPSHRDSLQSGCKCTTTLERVSLQCTTTLERVSLQAVPLPALSQASPTADAEPASSLLSRRLLRRARTPRRCGSTSVSSCSTRSTACGRSSGGSRATRASRSATHGFSSASRFAPRRSRPLSRHPLRRRPRPRTGG